MMCVVLYIAAAVMSIYNDTDVVGPNAWLQILLIVPNIIYFKHRRAIKRERAREMIIIIIILILKSFTTDSIYFAVEA